MDFYDAWNASLEDIKKQVTGTGVWNALNVAIPITLEEDGTFVLGVVEKEVESRGHLTQANTRRVMEQELGKKLGRRVEVAVIDGITINHWESLKRRREEFLRLEREAAEKAREKAGKTSAWDTIYEQMGREFGELQGKAMPQVRARFMLWCVDLVAAHLHGSQHSDDDERNFSRCVDRIAAYADANHTYIAAMILEREL
jgi:hypothetical protein